jgi:hypothetical protein
MKLRKKSPFYVGTGTDIRSQKQSENTSGTNSPQEDVSTH